MTVAKQIFDDCTGTKLDGPTQGLTFFRHLGDRAEIGMADGGTFSRYVRLTDIVLRVLKPALQPPTAIRLRLEWGRVEPACTARSALINLETCSGLKYLQKS